MTMPARVGVALLVVSLVACSGKDSRGGQSSGQNEIKTLSSEKPATTESSSASPSAPVMSRQEAQQREVLSRLGKELKATKDALERADLVGKAKDLGPAAKPLWGEIVKALDDEEPELRQAAIEAIAAIDPASARPHLEKALKDPEPAVRQRAAEAWGTAKINELGPLLDRVQDELEERVQMAMMATVEKLGQDYHAAKVAAVLGSLEPNAAKPAVRFLAAKKAAGEVPRLIEVLNWRDPELRAETARALGTLQVKTKPVYVALARALEDDELMVRRAAADALKTLSGQSLEFDPDAPEAERKSAAAAWRSWAEKSG